MCAFLLVLNCFYTIIILQHVRVICANKYYLLRPTYFLMVKMTDSQGVGTAPGVRSK